MSRRTTIATLALALLAGPALAEPTAITIRAISHDGKFIGDSMGGVRVRLTEAASGRELAAGTTSGTTGDTRKLVVEPRQRQTPIHTPDASALPGRSAATCCQSISKSRCSQRWRKS